MHPKCCTDGSQRLSMLPKWSQDDPKRLPEGPREPQYASLGSPKVTPWEVLGTLRTASSTRVLLFAPFLLHLGYQTRPKIIKKSTKKPYDQWLCFGDVFTSPFRTKKHGKIVPNLKEKTSKLRNGEFWKIVFLLWKNDGFQGLGFPKNEENRIRIYAGNPVGFLTWF